ncbi:hypothetical protein F4678DRAFT_484945 [Xylaria arbuscula]|nr:hypothetical protein F4678DRAFT_484945 [Xylaria arbuscula]
MSELEEQDDINSSWDSDSDSDVDYYYCYPYGWTACDIPSPTESTILDMWNKTKPSSYTIKGGKGSFPKADGLYMIRDLDSGKVITLVDGRLTLVQDASTTGGWYWRCKERDGLFGFRDAISDNYIGHNHQGGLDAQARLMRSSESFMIRGRKNGGYRLMVMNGTLLRPIAIVNEAGELPRLIESPSPDEDAWWEFVKVDARSILYFLVWGEFR